ncbi:uncharacterized protein METZ01_LOCUS406014 [marine metagenome]|uniref:Uncharacterized protein n=1 Tax=marine metagenome TaxID=408172 RepID=A0A382W3I1_9ZZZZ
MQFDPINPPRKFTIGAQEQFEIMDCGKILLNKNEQVTFTTESGGEYDLTRKDWGFYATPSLNGRLPSFGLRGVLIKNRETNRFFVLLVEKGKEALFDDYCNIENLAVVAWLDCEEALKDLEKKLEDQ